MTAPFSREPPASVCLSLAADHQFRYFVTRNTGYGSSSEGRFHQRRFQERRNLYFFFPQLFCDRETGEGGGGGLFGIVQGSVYRDLRERAARELSALDFDGYAIGGVAVGEPEAERRTAVEWTAPALPADRPRYLMGVGYPADILHAVAQGVDLFDCVLPARNARHAVLFTRQGVLKIKNARFDNVVLNGQVIHRNVELKTPTGHYWRNKEVERGPILLQGDHGPVAFRNIRVRPL